MSRNMGSFLLYTLCILLLVISTVDFTVQALPSSGPSTPQSPVENDRRHITTAQLNDERDQCPICYEEYQAPNDIAFLESGNGRISCQHIYCVRCAHKLKNRPNRDDGRLECSLCRTPFIGYRNLKIFESGGCLPSIPDSCEIIGASGSRGADGEDRRLDLVRREIQSEHAILFRLFDTDGDGRLTRKQVRYLAKCLLPNEPSCNVVIRRIIKEQQEERRRSTDSPEDADYINESDFKQIWKLLVTIYQGWFDKCQKFKFNPSPYAPIVNHHQRSHSFASGSSFDNDDAFYAQRNGRGIVFSREFTDIFLDLPGVSSSDDNDSSMSERMGQSRCSNMCFFLMCPCLVPCFWDVFCRCCF